MLRGLTNSITHIDDAGFTGYELAAALEGQRTEETEKKRLTFYESQLTKRLAFSDSSERKARQNLESYRRILSSYEEMVSGKKFSNAKLQALVSHSKIIAYSDLSAGLRQIEHMSSMLKEIIDLPLDTNTDMNLKHFKEAIVRIVKTKMPSYGFHDFRVYARFVIDRHKGDTTSFTTSGYGASFLSELKDHLHKADEQVSALISMRSDFEELAKKITAALMADPIKHKHSRRQFQLDCTIRKSLLEQSWNQYVNAALTVAHVLTQCYE